MPHCMHQHNQVCLLLVYELYAAVRLKLYSVSSKSQAPALQAGEELKKGCTEAGETKQATGLSGMDQKTENMVEGKLFLLNFPFVACMEKRWGWWRQGELL